MKLPAWAKRIRVIATLGGIAFGVLMLSSLYFVHFRFSHQTNSENRDELMALVKSSLQASLEYPLTMGEADSIQKIVDELVKLDTIYGIEVRDKEGRVVSRMDGADGKQIPVIQKTFNITAKQVEGLSLDPKFDLVGKAEETTVLGTVTVSFSALTATEKLDSALNLHAGVVVGLLMILALSLGSYVWTQHRFIGRMRDHVGMMRRGERIEPVREFIEEYEDLAREIDGLSGVYAERGIEAQAFRISQSRALDQITGTEQGIQELIYKLSAATKSTDGKVVQGMMSAALKDLETHLGKLRSVKRFRQVVESRINESPSMFYVEGLVDALASQWGDGRVKVQCQGTLGDSDGKTGNVSGKPETISLVVRELISNALRFDDKGIITLGWKINSDMDSDWLEISVDDQGRGIHKEIVETMFDPFVSGGKNSGFGVGLSIVKHLVNSVKGSITVEEKAIGARISIAVPVLAERVPETPDVHDMGSVGLIDDNVYSLDVLRSWIRNCSIFEGDPKKADITGIDVMFIDMTMTGRDTIRSIRDIRDNNPMCQVVLMTCGPRQSLIEKLGADGVEGYVISKPVSQVQLEEVSIKLREYKATVSDLLGKITFKE